MASRKTVAAAGAAPSRGRFVGTGNGPAFQPIDIGHADYVAVVEPDTAFWALVRREKLAELALGGPLSTAFRKRAARFAEEMHALRFGLTPSAVYFNPTERCNLDCTYCYIPRADAPPRAAHVPRRVAAGLGDAAAATSAPPASSAPQIIFHGAEPLLNREAVFAGIEKFADDFRFGIQTNATLLDDQSVEFLRSRERQHRHFARCPHRRGGRPHAQELAGRGRPAAGLGSDGAAGWLPGLERHLHRSPARTSAN